LAIREITIPKLYLEEICVGACGRKRSRVDKSVIIRSHTAWLGLNAPDSGVTDTAGDEGGGRGERGGGGGVGDDASSAMTWTLSLCMGETGFRNPFVILVCSIDRDSCLQTLFARRAKAIGIKHGKLELDVQAMVMSLTGRERERKRNLKRTHARLIQICGFDCGYGEAHIAMIPFIRKRYCFGVCCFGMGACAH